MSNEDTPNISESKKQAIESLHRYHRRREERAATDSEVGDVVAVRSAEESTLRDVARTLIDALNRTRVLKAFSGHADLTQQTSDELWREVDLLQADLEVALDRLDPRELDDWLSSRW